MSDHQQGATDGHVDDFNLELDYAPDGYATFDPDRPGRWRTYSEDGLYRGVIWTDGEKGAGFLMGDEDLIPGSHAVSVWMINMFRTMKRQGVPAIMAYQAIQHTPGAELGQEQTGPLLQAIQIAHSLQNEDAATAAGEHPIAEKVNYYAAFDADTEEFDELVRSDVHGTYIYDSGGWHQLPADDDSQDGREWIALGDDGIRFVARSLDEGNRPSREQVLRFSID